MDVSIKQHIGLLKSLLKQYNLENDTEAQSIAYESLWKALKDFDASLGHKQSTLITVYIKNALGTYLRSLKRQQRIQIISYNNLVDNEVEYLSVLTNYETAEDAALQRLSYLNVREAYNATLSTLSDRKKRIIKEWADSGFKKTNNDIAQSVGVSQPYVNQVIAEFKQKLKGELACRK